MTSPLWGAATVCRVQNAEGSNILVNKSAFFTKLDDMKPHDKHLLLALLFWCTSNINTEHYICLFPWKLLFFPPTCVATIAISKKQLSICKALRSAVACASCYAGSQQQSHSENSWNCHTIGVTDPTVKLSEPAVIMGCCDVHKSP